MPQHGCGDEGIHSTGRTTSRLAARHDTSPEIGRIDIDRKQSLFEA